MRECGGSEEGRRAKFRKMLLKTELKNRGTVQECNNYCFHFK